MTLINGLIKDSGGVPLEGRLTVTANDLIVDETTTPHGLITKEYHIFDITNGIIDIDIPSSELQQVSYLFEVEVLEDVGEVQEVWKTVLSFNAQVPNVYSIDFDQLTPTDFTRDQLDAGKFAVARILATNPQFADALKFNFNYKGAYSPNTLYCKHDVVIYDGSSYVYTNNVSALGAPIPAYPIETNQHWQAVSFRGPTGSGTSGNNTPFGQSWNYQIDTPSRNVVYDEMIKKAPIISPNFLGEPRAMTPPIADMSNRIATQESLNYKNADILCLAMGDDIVEDTVINRQLYFDRNFNSNPNIDADGLYTVPYKGIYQFQTTIGLITPDFLRRVYVIIQVTDGNYQNIRHHVLLDLIQPQAPGLGTQGTFNASSIIFLNLGDIIRLRLYAVTVNTDQQITLRGVQANGTRNTTFGGVCLQRY